MRRWLAAAGIYNLIWGAAMVLAPVTTLNALGVAPGHTDLWPQLWACIGMIVGVYGVGYLIAARDPARHWPIVLVGLLGKILGPIGFVDAAVRGDLPWSMGVTILTNDLLWWIPFGMILWHAARVAQPAPPPGRVTLAEALDRLRDDRGRPLRTITDERRTLVVLLRHAGCTFCRQTLADLAQALPTLRRQGVGLLIVGMSNDPADLKDLGARYAVTDAAWCADPDRLLYRALDLGRGSFRQLFGPRVWIAAALATLRGHVVGTLQGDGFQMPGAFLIHGDRVLRAHRHATAADRPNLEDLACPIT
jgi:uncharacterized membrane protein HdeD (DUF308 family)